MKQFLIRVASFSLAVVFTLVGSGGAVLALEAPKSDSKQDFMKRIIAQQQVPQYKGFSDRTKNYKAVSSAPRSTQANASLLSESSPYNAKVWLTLPDKSKLVHPEADLPISYNVEPNASALSVRVDPSKTHQTMDGVGAAMTESSAYLFSEKLTAQQRSLVFPALFDKQNGAGLDVLRVPWGVTDFSPSTYTYNDLPSGQQDVPQNNFSIAHDQNYMIPRLHDARTVNPNIKLFFAPWTQPAWMKNASIPQYPLSLGVLKPGMEASYATYLAKAVNGYTSNYLWPHAMSVQNEPGAITLNYSTVIPAVDPSGQEVVDQTELIKDHVGPKIQSSTMAKPKIMVHDDNWGKVNEANTVLADSGAASQSAGTAFHCYEGESYQQLLTQKAHPDKDIYFTECSGFGDPEVGWGGDFKWGMRNLIINATRNYAKTIMYWNLALDENYGPKNPDIPVCADCHGLITINSTTGAVSPTPEYYILSHYGKFVDQGATRIDSTTYGEGAIETVAFKNPNGKKTLIAQNSGSVSRDFTVREGNAAFSYTLPAGAAATFKWDMPDNNTKDVDTGRIEAESYSSSQPANVQIINVTDDGRADQVARMTNDQEIRFSNTTFQGVPVSFQMRYQALASGTVEFRTGSATGPLLASIPFTPTAWKTSAVTTGTVSPTAGTHTLYVVLKHPSASAIDINWFKFAETPTSNDPITGKSNWKAYGVYGGGSDIPANVLDSNNSTRWTAGNPMTLGHWFVLDLGKQTVINTLGAYSANGDYPRKLKIEVSDNGLDYKTFQPNSAQSADLYSIPLTEKTMGRYVRLTELSENQPGSWWSMNEINLYNKP